MIRDHYRNPIARSKGVNYKLTIVLDFIKKKLYNYCIGPDNARTIYILLSKRQKHISYIMSFQK